MLIFDRAISRERDTRPIHNSQSEEQNGLWMSVEIEGKVSSGVGSAGQPRVLASMLGS